MALIYLLVKTVLSTLCLTFITHLKYSVRKSAVIITAFSVVIWLANYAVYRVWGAVVLGNIFLLTASVPTYIGFYLISRSKLSKVLFSALTVTILGMPVSFIGQLSFLYWKSFLLEWAIEIVIYVLLLVFVAKVFRKPYLKILDALDKGWELFCVAAVLMLSIIYVLQYYPTPILYRPENIPVVFLIDALIAVFYLIIYLNLENMSHYYQLMQDRKLVTVQMDMHKREYEALLENVNTMKIYRHDMIHYLTAIDSLLGDGNTSEAHRFIHKLSGSLDSTILEHYCENYVVNVILSAYIQKAKNEHIKVDCEATVSQEISIDPIELGLVFANAIDNAINACKKIEDASGRIITIQSKEHYGQICIRISNPFEGEVVINGDFPVSLDAEHGTGTRSIAAIAQKNGGVFAFTAQNGIFNTTVTMG